MMKRSIWMIWFALLGTAKVFSQQADSAIRIQFVFTADEHYGLTRGKFGGQTNVDAQVVNQALVHKINSLSTLRLPDDHGVWSGKKVGPVDFIVIGGDVTNRMEGRSPPAAISWNQFKTDYLDGVALTDHAGKPTRFYIVPGNHDVSNAIGFYKPMHPTQDPTPLVQMYNLMVDPARPLTLQGYRYDSNKINYSTTLGGIHFQFINIWPDSSERIWMEQDLQSVPTDMPVILFAHDPPSGVPRHFTNPNPPHDINAQDQFENLLPEYYKDGPEAGSQAARTTLEQLGWVQFLRRHHNIKAYFHGHTNFNEYYAYRGPSHDIYLPTFRVDSPMKGKYSTKNQKRLSFQLITIDAKAGSLTVRECLWNAEAGKPDSSIKWGRSETISLK